MKNVELTDQSKKRRAGDIDFIEPSVYEIWYKKETWSNLPFEYTYICYVYFWIHLFHAGPRPVDLWLTHKKTIFMPQLIIKILEFQ